MTPLPTPSLEAQKHSQQLIAFIQENIEQAGGWLDFAQFMQSALYATGLGYYSAGSQKFGAGGDFATAPEISPLFAQTLANQMAQILKITNGSIIELGAGTGKLATDLLLTLAELEIVPNKYFILEVSNYLRQIQLEHLQKKLPAELMQRVEWLDHLPAAFTGVIVGNEVLDAIAVRLVHNGSAGVCERGVVTSAAGFDWQDRLIEPGQSHTQDNFLHTVNKLNLPEGYLTELCPAAGGLISSLAHTLQHGAILMMDYGFSAAEYYHPQRNQGTLMCHYQHLAHTNPLIYVGLQDITAHVDFTSIAQAGINNGLALAGFCSQAQFLLNCGILELMSQVSPHDMVRYAPLAAAAQKLLSPAEMGDLFKVIAFTKNIETSLMGFSSGDKSHTL